MRKIKVFLLIMIINFGSCLFGQSTFRELNYTKSNFIKGVDVSALEQIEENGGVFYDDGLAMDALQIFKNHDINYIRLRLWHTPDSGYNNLARTLEMAARVKDLGYKFLLDFHYSDTWADPGQQIKPDAWQNLSFQTLKDSIYHYTKYVITALKEQNTIPDMVQIGNEIICGLLWNDGRVCGEYNTPSQWEQLSELITEAINGLDDSLEPTESDSVKIMIHIDRSCDNNWCRWFFDNLTANNVNFDVIGLSYYPWWHGLIDELEYNVNDLAQYYSKEIVIVETAYPWTLNWFDDTHNLVGDSTQLHPGYTASVEGQTSFLHDVMETISNVPDNKGLGIFYWAPEWISVPNFGSPWENVTLFDFNGELLNSITVFDSSFSEFSEETDISGFFYILNNYPNPFNPKTTIEFSLSKTSKVNLSIYNIKGQKIITLTDKSLKEGYHSLVWNGSDASGQKAASGVYVYKLMVNDKAEFIRKCILLK